MHVASYGQGAGAGRGRRWRGGVRLCWEVAGGKSYTGSTTLTPLSSHLPSLLQGRDHTLFALTPGVVTFRRDRLTGRKTVSIVPEEK